MRRFLLSTAILGSLWLPACRERKSPPPSHAPAPVAAVPAPPPTPRTETQCQQLPFADNSPIAEASSGRWATIDGAPAIVIVSDSGNHGAYELLDPATGTAREHGVLQLGTGASDDLEGASTVDDVLYGLTSSGWVRAWKRDHVNHRFILVDGPYAIGAVGKGQPACEGTGINCGLNYEGLCLRPKDSRNRYCSSECIGFAAAKATGDLVCITLGDNPDVRQEVLPDRLVADLSRTIHITRPQALADCDISPDGKTLWAGSNVFEGGRVFRVDNWQDPAQAKVVPFAYMPIGNAEGLAVDPTGDFYRFSDSNSAPSLQAKFRCSAPGR